MNANELRIGNYFLESYEGYKIIAGINHHNDLPITVDAHAIGRKICGRYDLDAMQPILLTEDILLKCGFEYRNENRGLGAILDFKNKEFDNWKYDMSVAFQHETDNKEIVYLHFLQHKTTNSIKYLHQLQNLYFALTQKELTIKL